MQVEWMIRAERCLWFDPVGPGFVDDECEIFVWELETVIYDYMTGHLREFLYKPHRPCERIFKSSLLTTNYIFPPKLWCS